MAVGSGLSATFGIATEGTPNTPVAATRFGEFDSEAISEKKHTVQGVGMRGGALTKRANRRIAVAKEVQGTVNFDVPTLGFGLFLQHMLGSFSTTATSIGGGLFQQIHNTGSLQGKTFTTQIVRPDITGVLTQNAYTISGCKITDWTISGAIEQQLKVQLSIDAANQFTPSDSFAATTLSSLSTAGASSMSMAASPGSNTYFLVDSGPGKQEILLSGTVTGSGPFTVPITPNAAYGHASGATVTAPTAVNAGAAAALQAASYTAGTSLYSYAATGSSLIMGGSTTVASGVWTNTGGTTIGNVRSFTLKGTNPLKVDRWGIGSQVKSEQLENDYRSYTLDLEIEYGSPYLYQNYTTDTPLAVLLKFTNPLVPGSYLQFYAPLTFQNDGTDPEVGGPDILIPKLSLELLDDSTNGAFQCVMVNTDAAV